MMASVKDPPDEPGPPPRSSTDTRPDGHARTSAEASVEPAVKSEAQQELAVDEGADAGARPAEDASADEQLEEISLEPEAAQEVAPSHPETAEPELAPATTSHRGLQAESIADEQSKADGNDAAQGQDVAQEREVPQKVTIPTLAPPPPPRAGSKASGSNGTATIPAPAPSQVVQTAPASIEDDEGEWQDMPVIRTITEENEHYAVLDEEDRKKYHYKINGRSSLDGAPGSPSDKRKSGAAGNATGRHLEVEDARGYTWRSKPAGIDRDESEDEEQGRGYTQIQLQEDEDAEKLHAATEYLFNDVNASPLDGPSATPASQMNTTKQLLSEGQRIAYVGLCSLLAKEIRDKVYQGPKGEDLKDALQSAEQWVAGVMSKLYIHMELDGAEQRMIEMLGEHGVLAADLAPTLATTQTVDNPDFDPQALADREENERKQAQEEEDAKAKAQAEFELGPPSPIDGEEGPPPAYKADEATDAASDDGDIGGQLKPPPPKKSAVEVVADASAADPPKTSESDPEADIGTSASTTSADPNATPSLEKRESLDSAQLSPATRARVLLDPNSMAQVNADNLKAEAADPGKAQQEVSKTLGLTAEPQAVEPPPNALDGVTTEISTADRTITLDIRWTVLCDLFLLLINEADYDARSRTLLENVAMSLGLTWLDVTKFEKRIADTLEIEEGVEKLKDQSLVEQRAVQAKKKRYLMMGLATVGGGLVIGLSAGLLAPLIGLGLGTALGTIGIGGTTAFLGGAGGAALITTAGTLGGAQMAGRGMSKRTRSVRTFEFKAQHNKKRFNCIIGVPGFMSGEQDDVRLPFSVIDSVMGDLFTVLWEPDMMREMGNAISILWNETLSSGVQQALALTFAGTLVGALAWPLWLSKLGYLIDNPWSNALDRAKAAGLILADILKRKHMGRRPITLIGFSLGARVIFYALQELYKTKGFGIVQNVYLIGAPVSANVKTWQQLRSVVSGRFVNAYSTSDWILGYLHRATAGGLSTVAGLHPLTSIPNVDNVDLTHIVPGHLAYRALMPLVLGEVGFKTTADYFDEPEELSKIPEREVVLEPTVTEEAEAPKSSTFANFFRRKKEGSSGVSSPARPLTPNLEQNLKQALSKYHADGGQSRAQHEYDYDEDADADVEAEPKTSYDLARQHGHSAQASATDSVDTSISSSTTLSEPPAALERDRDSRTAVVFDTDQMLDELRTAGIQVKELPTSLPTLDSVATPKFAQPAALGRRESDAAQDRTTSFSRPGIAPSLSFASSQRDLRSPGSGALTPTTESVRDRTLGKSLPTLGSDAGVSSVWGQGFDRQPSLSSAPASGWGAEEPRVASAFPQSYVPNQPGISMTFASYEDDDIIDGEQHSSSTSHGFKHDASAAPQGPQLSFGGHDGSISIADDNPWQ